MTTSKKVLLNLAALPIVRFLRFSGSAIRAWSRLLNLSRARTVFTGPIPASTQFDGRIHGAGTGAVTLGEECRLGRDVFFETQENGRITVGSHVRINAGSLLVSYAAISIGDDTLIGEFVSIRDANHEVLPGAPIRLQPHARAPIYIGRDVWIGRGVAVLKGVTIGDGAVVAANSVVNRDVPPGALVAGAPAETVRTVR